MTCPYESDRNLWTRSLADDPDNTVRKNLANIPIREHAFFGAHALRVWEQIVRREARKRGLL